MPRSKMTAPFNRGRVGIVMAGVVALVLTLGAVGCDGTKTAGAPPPVEIIRICAGSPVPPGYVITNDRWDPTSCGNPSTISPNVATYQRYDNKPIGAEMTVCAGPVPKGWTLVKAYWNPTACGHPGSAMDNVYAIQRVS